MTTRETARAIVKKLNSFVLVGVFLLMAAAIAVPFYSARSHSAPIGSSDRTVPSRSVIKRGPSTSVPGSSSTTLSPWSSVLPLSLTLAVPPPSALTVATYAGDCSTAKSVFNVQDTDKVVCAKVTGATPGWQLIWSNSNNVAVQTSPITAADQDITFTLTTSSTVGDWRVIAYEPFGGTVQAVTVFTVIDAQNPKVDLGVSKSAASSEIAAGAQAIFFVQVSNAGPDAATSVQLTDSIPANTSFVSFTQLSGPTFTCNNPNANDTSGSSVCTLANMQRGEVATFVGTYQVSSGAVVGSTISNTASVSNTVADSNPDNDSSSATENVVSAPCVLTCPSNITVDADSGQAGAIVTYADPSSTGDCGQATVDEFGNPVPPTISSNPASGSFFPVGTTTVLSTSQTGAVCSFQVTVNNPGGLSISLNGANPLTLECGTGFNDPGASAVNGTGQSVPVTTTLPGGFSPDAPAVGSYTLTYTATEGSNSVSTTRTVNVVDTEAPAITVAGANPYRIEQGSCAPFSDPGASSLDACAGPKPVTSSISGPGGLTSVDTNTPGTYIVTYTATDGTHSATATRKVLVGQFPQDEVDQPQSSNLPPTITLNCPTGVTDCSQLEIECGTPFTDLGATATVCGGSVQVTTSGSVDIHTPGTYVITYSATANGQTSTATRTVTVDPDNTPPTITLNGANPMTVECHSTFTDPGAVAHDACAGDFPATASGSVNANVVGTYTITYNATDPSGHAATPVTRTVIVSDTTAPVVTPPANVTVSTGAGATSCGATVSDATLGTATASDACAGSLSVTRTGVPAGNVFPVGQTTITYSANDGFNTGTATQTVTVIDNTAPTISCPVSITLEPTCPSGAKAFYTAPVGTDNCAGAVTTRTAGPASGSVFPIGTTTVTHTVTDASGNTASCSFTVTVLTPQVVIQNLIDSVNSSSLDPNSKGGLVSKLQAALDGLNTGHTNVACNKLDAFINSVQTLVSHGNITSAQGTSWINSASHVENTIGCTNNPCT